MRLDPPDADPAWVAAARAARERVGNEGDMDCREVTIKVTLTGAVVIFTTRDGRRAVRELASARELAATIEALSVTLAATHEIPTPYDTPAPEPAPAAAAAGGAQPPSTSAGGAPAASGSVVGGAGGAGGAGGGSTAAAAPEKPSAPATSAAVRTGAALGAFGGARAAFPGPHATPVFGVSAAFALASWELASLSQWEPGYDDDAFPQVRRVSAFATAVSVGRRVGFGRSFELVAAASLGGAAVREQTPVLGNATRVTAEARASLHLDALVRLVDGARLRAMLVLDAAPTRFLPADDPGFGFGHLPTWSLGANLGGEADLQ